MESHVVPSGDISSNEHITSSIKENKSDGTPNEDANIQHNKEESFDKNMQCENNDKVCRNLVTLINIYFKKT